MALMNCRECQSQVSDAAVTCPRCGVDGPAGTGRLVVTRQKQLMAAILPVSVVIDGVIRGKVSPGQELQLNLSPGAHDVVLGFSKGDVRAAVTIRSGRTATCLASVSKWDGSLKVQLDEE